MSYVFLLDTNKRPLDPVHPGRARRLLTEGKAAVFRYAPFTLILKTASPEAHTPQPLRLKIDPGSRTTGLALVQDTSGEVVWAAELTHRGEQIKAALASRRSLRRNRRQRKTRYRKPRHKNRVRPKGWLPPSLRSRIENTLTWVNRLRRAAPIAALSQEVVRFDTQILQNPEINGVQYQQGELYGFEVREFLLLKWEHACAYCGAEGLPLEVEHIVPKSRGGSDRISNLTLACRSCNQSKGNKTAEEFGFPAIQAQAKRPLKDAAAVNATRWALYNYLKLTELPVETGTGGRTKWNRTRRNLPKTHWLDAANIGASTPEKLQCTHVVPLLITATGRQRRQMCLMDRFGFPRSRAKKTSIVHGFQTGDFVRAIVPAPLKHAGVHIGRVAVKAKGAFTIATVQGIVPDISYRYCTKLQRSDGYSYQLGRNEPLLIS
jgi:5-methylcytosine-specific restriction endonuclease McrA